MRTIINILAILVISACNNARQNQKPADESLVLVPVQDKNLKEVSKGMETTKVICSAIDFMQLSQKDIQTNFFYQLDSILKVQYPNNDQERCNSVDLTPYLLNEFLIKIDKETFQQSGEFTVIFNFNIACPKFYDSEICQDKISVRFFDKTCSFRIVIENNYMVEGDCIGGSQVVYGFDLQNSKVVNLNRQEAG